MKSPITGKEMKIISEKRKLIFRKEEFELFCKFYLCEDTGEKFTDSALDNWNMNLLHNLYRAKHKIPNVEEIKAIRDQYELSAAQMGSILGFGTNTYRLYENGDIPSLPNARLMKAASFPEQFRKLVEDWEPEKAVKKQKLVSLVDKIIHEQHKGHFSMELKEHLLGGDDPDEFTGFRKPSLERFAEMVVFFAQLAPCYKTKMNKLLFYADAMAFNHLGFSISGSKYRAIEYGPVPYRYESLYDELVESKHIDVISEDQGTYVSKKLIGRKERGFNQKLFNDKELAILTTVATTFKDLSTAKIVEISHAETAWLQSNSNRELISYQLMMDLKAFHKDDALGSFDGLMPTTGKKGEF